jgi:MoaA/NifB/PqqE/SkfB family radical SAM enzyme
VPEPPHYAGWLEQISPFHVAGWAENPADAGERTQLVVRRSDTGEILAQGPADHFRHTNTSVGAPEEGHCFYFRFAKPLPEAALPHIEVLPPHGAAPLARSQHLSLAYEPLVLVAGDIVDNCNLRCPFCLFDYTNVRSTNVMDEATIEAALRFLPYVTDANFWFSCLHEPTLHPDLMRFVDKVPREWRKKIFFTTNLAKRMPPDYYPWLIRSGLHHINISIESRVPDIYEKMRKGARFRIFQENWDLLMQAAGEHPDPLRIQYIAMVYRSNHRELPDLVRHLLEERRGALVELRYTFNVPWLPAEFRDAEFLDAEGWLWLRDQLSGYTQDRVRLVLPPNVKPQTPSLDIEVTNRTTAASGKPADHGVRHFLPGRYQTRLSWNGNLEISPFWAHPFEEGPGQKPMCNVNVRDIADPVEFLLNLPD